MTDVSKTLAERGARYGSFEEHAAIAQGLQEVLWDTKNWYKLPTDVRQCLIVITDKMARICNGDPDYTDNYHDIQGYAKLVEDRLLREQQERKGELFESEEPVAEQDVVQSEEEEQEVKPTETVASLVKDNLLESRDWRFPTSDRNAVERERYAYDRPANEPVNGDWDAVGNYRG